MSSPGPDWIVACPHCEAPARRATYGFINAGMFAQSSDDCPFGTDIRECRSCERSFPIDEANILWTPTTQFHRDESPPQELRARARSYLEPASEMACYRELARLGPDHAWAVALRVEAWRRHSRTRLESRDYPDASTRSLISRANMEVLLVMLTARKPEANGTIAELLRQLGRFDEALALLSEVVDDGSGLVAAQRHWCAERVSTVMISRYTPGFGGGWLTSG